MQSPTPVRLELRDAPPPAELVERVRDTLAADGLVALPTETVYGVAARADNPAALERLAALKGRPPQLAWTWHVGTRDAVERFDELRPLARRLAARYWPGPLTLVLHGVPAGLEHAAREGWTGVRMPAHQGVAGVLAALDFPVVMSSANRHGEDPAVDADGVVAAVGDELDLLVDGGPTRVGEASGVVRVGRGRFELLREGLLPVEDLRATAGLSLLFVCTGNTCRSPMAEGIARAILAERLGSDALADFGFELASMGVFAGPGAPAARHAVDVMAAQGIDLRGHRSRPATPEGVARFDEIYCLTAAHAEALREKLPPSRAESIRLLDPEGRDVPDPIGGSRADYEACAARIREAIEARAASWA